MRLFLDINTIYENSETGFEDSRHYFVATYLLKY